MNLLQRVFMNASFRTFGEVGRKLIGFGFVLFLGRAIGAEGLGEYGAMLYYTNLFAMFVDAGLNTLYTRDSARSPESRQSIMSALLLIKMMLSGAVLLIMSVITYLV
ncbi:MAG: oligosaccharide flippase family protein, partial [Candidatus Coatesbacteria bacterium]|nr:oligosaccharide flippase family protein [Candidatus Coatesbacteria bacterium]